MPLEGVADRTPGGPEFATIYIYIVVVLRNSQNIIKVPLRSDISVSPCVVSTNLLYSGFHVIQRAVDLQVVFFFIYCSFGANDNNTILQQHPTSSSHHTPRFLHTPRSHHTSTPRHTSSSQRRHFHYTHHQRHSPSNGHREVTFPARRMETRRGAARFLPKHPRGPLRWLSIGLFSRTPT